MNIWKETGANISDTVTGRAHRIGNTYCLSQKSKICEQKNLQEDFSAFYNFLSYDYGLSGREKHEGQRTS